MILYHDRIAPRLADYGVLIPAPPDRPERILEALRSDPGPEIPESIWRTPWEPVSLEREDLLRAHDATYVDRIFSPAVTELIEAAFELRDSQGNPNRYHPAEARFPLSELANGRIADAAGTYLCCSRALLDGISCYLGGGAHHAHRGFGHGFCLVNDTVIALRKLQYERRIERAWVIDVDAHKGDGTAAITHGDDTIRTLSVHMAHGWPLDGAPIRPDGTLHPSFIPSDIDVPIDKGEDRSYLSRLGSALDTLGDYGTPDLAVVLLGADPYEHDSLASTASMALTLDEIRARDLMIYEFLEASGVRQAYLMAGGYGPHAWEPYPHFFRELIGRTHRAD